MNDGSKPYLLDSHHNGRMALLRLRGSRQLNTFCGHAMFRMVYMAMVGFTPLKSLFMYQLNDAAAIDLSSKVVVSTGRYCFPRRPK
jgi:hypothetical protein